MTTQAKICGINTPESMTAAVKHGAAHIGLVFFPKSPRDVSPEEAAMLAARVPPQVNTVGLFVNPEDALIDRVLEAVPLDILQLHGSESPERCAEIKARTGRQVMKALPVREADDLIPALEYQKACDWLLFDAKAPEGADRPGGNAVAFDWQLLTGKRWEKPWMLAGGLTADNVASAIRLTAAPHVDTSSGVEDSPGVKNPHKIGEFLRAVATV